MVDKAANLIGINTRVGDPFDIRERVEAALHYRLAFEDLITTLSTNFISLEPNHIDDGINAALQAIGQFAGVDRSYVLLFSKDGSRVYNTHEWCADGIEPTKQRTAAWPRYAFPWMTSRIKQLSVIHIPAVSDLPDEASAERDEFLAQRNESMILVPMVYLGAAIGFLGFDSVCERKTWSDESIVLLKIVGEMFVNVIMRKRSEEELRRAHNELERRVDERTTELQRANAILKFEVAERRRVEEELQYRVNFENLITTISTNFISLAPSEIDDGINRALQQIGEFAGVDRSYVLLYYNDGGWVDTTHEWCAEGITPAIERVRTSPVSKIAWIDSMIKQLRVVHVPSLSVIPAEANDERKEFESQGIQSIILVPMAYRGKAVGLLGFDAVRSPKEWSDQSIKLLKIVGETFVNVLERKRVEDALRESQRTLEQRVEERTREIERRRNVAEGLRDILTVLNSSRSLNEILDLIIEQASNLLGAQCGAVYRTEGDGRLFTVHRYPAAVSDLASGTLLKTGTKAIRLALRQRHPVAIPDLGNNRARTDPAALPGVAGIEYRALLAAPVFVKSESYGGIVLFFPDQRSFSNEELVVAMTCAGHAALAIENANLRAQVEETAIAAERSRLARDLHDAVTQTLFSTSLIAETLPLVWKRDQEEGFRGLEELKLLTDSALTEMRTLLLELRPAALTEVSLPDLLRQLCNSVVSRSRIPVELVADGDYDLPADVRVACYRISQEALNNMVHHSSAGHAQVILKCTPESVQMRIKDDGRGFDKDSIAQGHFGIGIMRERAESVNAGLKINSQIGQGTEICLTWESPSRKGRRHAAG